MKTWIIYKHTLEIEGPYKGWSYIGQTCIALHKRFRNGKGYLKSQSTALFGKAILKYGWENFKHEILEENIDSKELADERERFWIFYFHTYIGDPNCKGFNSTKGGNSWGTLNKIKIYNSTTEEKIFINQADLSDFEKLGWEKWYTPERKKLERKKYYESHKEHEKELSRKNSKAKYKKSMRVPQINVKLNRADFTTYEEYSKAYSKEYKKLYHQLHKEKINKQCLDWQKTHKEQANKNANNYYYRKKEKLRNKENKEDKD